MDEEKIDYQYVISYDITVIAKNEARAIEKVKNQLSEPMTCSACAESSMGRDEKPLVEVNSKFTRFTKIRKIESTEEE